MRAHLNDSVMYESREARRTLNPDYMTSYHVQAQWAELTYLKDVIGTTFEEFKRPITVFDIGIGYSRVPCLLSDVATWQKIAKYVGIDIAEFCLTRSRKEIEKKGIADKVELIKFDALELCTPSSEILKSRKYDLVVCTYFTGGDFKPPGIRLRKKADVSELDYDPELLNLNEAFQSVFKGAYDLLEENGKIVIGSIYCDTELARQVQEEFYVNCKMKVITSSKDPFTATNKGFWSQRFDRKRIYNYLSWVPRDRIKVIRLDDYDFAVMVLIHKQ